VIKTVPGNFFEDFESGQEIVHATPRTVTSGDVALYTALYGPRFALQSSDVFARACGMPQAPVDDLLVFHIVFGKTVPDISLNAVANLGYAEGRFLAPVFPGETLSAVSRVIGLKENSSGRTGVVWVRTEGRNQRGETVLSYVRWVMVRKGDEAAPAPRASVPELAGTVPAAELIVPRGLTFRGFDRALSGSPHLWADYEIGERIDHMDGMTVEEAEHMLATHLYQNTARVHFNQHAEAQGRFGRRLIYGGHVISLARALSFNGLGNACLIAGETVYAWSEVLDKAEIEGRSDTGALRLRLVATKNRACADFPLKSADGTYDSAVILDFDYWALAPR
jgi:2-methylfumaryl-CoA hydratase